MINKILIVIVVLIITSCKTKLISEINVKSNKPKNTKVYLIESKNNISFSRHY